MSNAISPLRVTLTIASLLLVSASRCYSADAVLIRSAMGSSIEQDELETAANFYGLNLKVFVNSSSDEPALIKVIERKETAAVVIAANALAGVSKNALLRALRQKPGTRAPLLILGVVPDTDPMLLRIWSGGTILGCRRFENALPTQYSFDRVDNVSQQLANLELPFSIADGSYFVLSEAGVAQPITSIRGEQVLPVFVETTVNQVELFVAASMTPVETSTEREGAVDAFLRLAPVMMFTKYSAGERGWHAFHHYANLTIDDPWLRQPYGYVDYDSLLEEMQKHDFHTTIAFIPWNYDRSKPGVISLFRDHPDRFSIAIHGNNHDHKEFTDYQSKPLDVQVGDIKQSLARMEKFRELTGISYDKVMVFPHSIAPESTLAALKRYNFLATINSSKIPEGVVVEPSDPSFTLRSVTLSFAGFPSIARYPAVVPVSDEFIAINEFLDNPLLFYTHAAFFSRGIAAFDSVADEVNRLDPETRWRSLGDIARHLYLVKLREDSNYDVLAFSSSLNLDNPLARDLIFYIRKQEIGYQRIQSVVVDEKPYPYRLEKGYLSLTIPVLRGTSRSVAIQYKNDLNLASIGTSHDSLIVYLLRLGSDFRDIYLSKSRFGLAVIRAYNDHHVEPGKLLASILTFAVVLVYVGFRLRRFARIRRLDKARSSAATS